MWPDSNDDLKHGMLLKEVSYMVMQLVLALVLPFLACVALTVTIGPAHFSLKWLLGMGVLYVAQAALLRNIFLEQRFKVSYPKASPQSASA